VYPATIIPSESKYKHMWDVAILLAVFYVAIVTPFDIGFDVQTSKGFEYFLTAFFIIDLFVNFRTTYYDDNKNEIGK